MANGEVKDINNHNGKKCPFMQGAYCMMSECMMYDVMSKHCNFLDLG